MRVRLCWRYREDKGTNYSAAQLMARIQNDDWERSIQDKIDRERTRGITHLLLVQPDEDQVQLAALIPLEAVLPVWCAQRDISAKLASAGKLGMRKKNHAMNGRSPTIYLRDDRHERAIEVAHALWDYPGVCDLAKLPAHDPPSGLEGAFGDPETNRLVERAAVEYVRSRYEQNGWKVRSVEQEGCGFDLECARGPEALHIEVKGVAGTTQSFNLTAGEYRRAQSDSLFRVALVTSTLTSPRLHEYDGRGLSKHFETTPLQYRVTPKTPP